MLTRTLSSVLTKAVHTFPAVILTGPRQSGKTTLLKKQFGQTHDYINLELPDVRLRAQADPAGFISQLKKPTIIDEIQYLPELLSYINVCIEEKRIPGFWLLTGSQNFALMEKTSQSLAGRAAVLSLLPLSVSELFQNGRFAFQPSNWLSELPEPSSNAVSAPVSQLLLRGLYPEISSSLEVDRDLWCSSYITTYLERDIRNLTQVGDLGLFHQFLRACAIRTGQILDLSSLAREIGVSFPTAKRWLSLLETGFQVLLVYPYYRHLGKRLVKRPKIYFLDPGLAAYLLGLNSPEIIVSSPYYGQLFETLVVTDFYKRFLHHGQTPSLFYLRTQDGLEIDLVIEIAGKLNLIEIKSSATITPDHSTSLVRLQHELKKQVEKALIISNSPNKFILPNNIEVRPVSSLCV